MTWYCKVESPRHAEVCDPPISAGLDLEKLTVALQISPVQAGTSMLAQLFTAAKEDTATVPSPGDEKLRNLNWGSGSQHGSKHVFE